MKTYKHENLFEDEESIKMFNSINKHSDIENKKKKEKELKAQKKEKRENIIFKTFVVASCVFILSSIIYIAHRSYEKNVTRCVNSGYAEDLYRNELSK